MVNRFGELDEEDAVSFAETIIESWKSVSSEPGAHSVPSHRERNLALVFLNLKYPFQCCGAKCKTPGTDDRCPDCPMRSHDA